MFPYSYIVLDDQERMVVTFPGAQSKYYILYQGDEPGAIDTPVMLQLGADEIQEFKERSQISLSATGTEQRFLRLREVFRSNPLDLDEDGIHDVFELEHGNALNPLDSSDADEDPDNDGQTNLQEFLQTSEVSATVRTQLKKIEDQNRGPGRSDSVLRR